MTYFIPPPKVENFIMDKLGFKVKVLTRTKENIGEIIKINPFLKLRNIDAKKLYITFLESKPKKEFINHLIVKKETDDIIEVIDSEVFIYCHKSYGKTVFSNNYIEKKLKLKATTRNWRTINKLFQLASE